MPKTFVLAHENPYSSSLASGGPLSQANEAGGKRRLQYAKYCAVPDYNPHSYSLTSVYLFSSGKRGWRERKAAGCQRLWCCSGESSLSSSLFSTYCLSQVFVYLFFFFNLYMPFCIILLALLSLSALNKNIGKNTTFYLPETIVSVPTLAG
jgi:hypothetical protein